MNSLPTRQTLRRTLRKRRKSLSPRQRRKHAQQLARRLATLPQLRHAKRVAAYHAVGSEISLECWLAQQTGSSVYVPRLRDRHMDFVATSSRQQHNRHGISEPRGGHTRPVWAFSVILLPLLGFDTQGNRLGQGGGYYDRALARLRWRRPWLIGVAFDQQRCDAIPNEPWDQALDGVVTPTQTLIFRK